MVESSAEGAAPGGSKLSARRRRSYRNLSKAGLAARHVGSLAAAGFLFGMCRAAGELYWPRLFLVLGAAGATLAVAWFYLSLKPARTSGRSLMSTLITVDAPDAGAALAALAGGWFLSPYVLDPWLVLLDAWQEWQLPVHVLRKLLFGAATFFFIAALVFGYAHLKYYQVSRILRRTMPGPIRFPDYVEAMEPTPTRDDRPPSP